MTLPKVFTVILMTFLEILSDISKYSYYISTTLDNASLNFLKALCTLQLQFSVLLVLCSL